MSADKPSQSEPTTDADQSAAAGGSVEMPRPTAAPMVLSLGLVLVAAGFATSPALLAVGLLIAVAGLGLWIGHLLPGRGHFQEPFVVPAQRARSIQSLPGTVDRLRAGRPGYRLRMPEQVHPISAGIKGGIIGGLVMPLPALAYGYFSGHGIWYPVNLLAGMVLPVVDERMDTAEAGAVFDDAA